jgi:Ca2+-binding RTX toxin-like protein
MVSYQQTTPKTATHRTNRKHDWFLVVKLSVLAGLFYFAMGPLAGTVYADGPDPASTPTETPVAVVTNPEVTPTPDPISPSTDPAVTNSTTSSADSTVTESTDGNANTPNAIAPADPGLTADLPQDDNTTDNATDVLQSPDSSPPPDTATDVIPLDNSNSADPSASTEAADGADSSGFEPPLDGQPIATSDVPVDDQQPVEDATLPDPQFCPTGTDPSSAGCTTTQYLGSTAIADAIGDATSAGTIYLEEGTTFTESINLLGQSTALTFSGGWNFTSNSQGSTSTLNAPINITNSSGPITFTNIIFGASGIVTVDGSTVIINGNSGSDAIEVTLAGTSAAAVTIDGNDGSDDVTLNLSGNAGNKTIHVNDSGGSGTDTLTVNGTSGNDGFQISNSSITLVSESVDFSGIETTDLNAGTGTDTLAGPNSPTTYNVTGTNSGDALGISFTSIENINGGTGSDTLAGPNSPTTYNVTGTNSGNALGISFTSIENINGGTGSDTLAGPNSPTTYNVTGTNSGNALGISFTSIENINGGTGSDIIAGPNSPTTFNVTGTNSGNALGINFSSIENVTGGSSGDTFNLSAAASLSGTLNGGTGSDIIAGPNSTTTYNVTGNYSGNVLGISFTSIENINGGTGSDTIAGPNSSSTYNLTGTNSGNTHGINFSSIEYITGGSSTSDLISGPNSPTTFNVTGTNSGNALGISFTAIENITGGTSNDIFNQSAGASLSGTLNGGNGSDTLNSANVATTFTITGANAGTLKEGATLRLTFTNMENLVGGTAGDFFVFNNAVSTGVSNITGNGGTDLLDYSSWSASNPVTANLSGGPATGVSSTVTGIENLTGGAGADTLTGNGVANVITGNAGADIITGGAGNDTLVGGLGDDTYVFANGWGVDTITENSGGGLDTLDFSAVTTRLHFVINNSNTTISEFSGSNQVNVSGSYVVENFWSGSYTNADPMQADKVDLDLNNNDVTYSTGDSLTGTSFTFNGITLSFKHVEWIKAVNGFFSLNGHGNLLADILQSLADFAGNPTVANSLAGFGLLAVGIPGIGTLGSQEGGLLRDSIGGVFDPQEALTDYLYAQVYQYFVTDGNTTTNNLSNVLTGITGDTKTLGADGTHLAVTVSSIDIHLEILGDCGVYCHDQLHVGMKYSATRQQSFVRDPAGLPAGDYHTHLDLNDSPPLIQEGFGFLDSSDNTKQARTDVTLTTTMHMNFYAIVDNLTTGGTPVAVIRFITTDGTNPTGWQFGASASASAISAKVNYGLVTFSTTTTSFTFAQQIRVGIPTSDLTSVNLEDLALNLSSVPQTQLGAGLHVNIPLALVGSIPGLSVSSPNVSFTDSLSLDPYDPTLTMTGFSDLAYFGNISASQLYALLVSLGSWFGNLDSATLQVPIPFAQAALLSSFMDFAGGLKQFTDAMQTGNKVNFSDAATFASAINLALGLAGSAPYSYNSSTHELTYDIIFTLLSGLPLPTAPLNLNYAIAPFSGLAATTSISVKIDTTLTYTLHFGIDLAANKAPGIKPEVSTTPTIVSTALPYYIDASDVIHTDIIGRLADDVKFVLGWTLSDDPSPTYSYSSVITVSVANTSTNTTVAHLVSDINAALSGSGITDVEAVTIPGSDFMFEIVPLDPDIKGLIITDGFNLAQIGLSRYKTSVYCNQQARCDVSGLDVPDTTGNLASPVTINLRVDTGSVNNYSIAIPATSGNSSLSDLVDDINNVLTTIPGLASVDGVTGIATYNVQAVVLSGSNMIAFRAVNANIRSLKITSGTNLDLLGYSDDKTSASMPTATPLPLYDGVTPTSAFATTFELAFDNVPYLVTVNVPANATIDDFVLAFNAGLSNAGLSSLVEAQNIFDLRTPVGSGVCPSGYGPVYRNDPITGLPDGTGNKLYTRYCYGDRIFLAGKDPTVKVIKIVTGDANLSKLGLSVDLFGRTHSDNAFVNNSSVSGSLTVALDTVSSFNATMSLGYAGLNINAATLSASLSYAAALKDPGGASKVSLATLNDNGKNLCDPYNLADTQCVASVTTITHTATASANFPVVPLAGDNAFGISAQTVTLTFTDWYTKPVDNSTAGTLTMPVPAAWTAAPAWQKVSFTDVIALFDDVTSYLQAVEADTANFNLNLRLPLVGLSVHKLVGYADHFETLVNIMRANSAATVKAFQSLLNSTLGSVATLAFGSSGLTIAFVNTISQTTNTPLSIDFDTLGSSDPNLFGVHKMFAADAGGNLSVTSGASLNLSMGLDTTQLAGQMAYISDTSTLSYTVNATAQNMDFRAKIGSLDLYVVGGSAALNADGNPAHTSPAQFNFAINGGGRHYFTDLAAILSATHETTFGTASVDLPLFYPSRDTVADPNFTNLTIDIFNLGTFLNGSTASVLISSLPNLGLNGGLLINAPSLLNQLLNPENLLDGLDLAFQVIQNAIDIQIFSINLPGIGNSLETLASVQWVNQLRLDILDYLAEPIRNAGNIDMSAALVLIQNAFVTVMGSKLQDSNGDYIINSGDITVTSDSTGPPECEGDATYCQFNMHLHDSITLQTNSLTTGLPNLGLTFSNAIVNLTYDWDWYFGFGVDIANGFYVDTNVTGNENSEIQLALHGTLIQETDPSSNISGTVIFLPFNAKDGTCFDSTTDPANPTGNGAAVAHAPCDAPFTYQNSDLQYNLIVDLKDPDANGRLAFGEIADPGTEPAQVISATLTGHVYLHLLMRTSFGDSVQFPGLGLDFNLIWEFGDGSVATPGLVLDPFLMRTGTADNGLNPLFTYAPMVEYANVKVFVGSFLTKYVKPILQAYYDVFHPLDWLINPETGFLFMVDPVMSFLTGTTWTILDELELLFTGLKNMRPFIDAIAYMYGLTVVMQPILNDPNIDDLYIPIGAVHFAEYTGVTLGDIIDAAKEAVTPDLGDNIKLEGGGPAVLGPDKSKSIKSLQHCAADSGGVDPATGACKKPAAGNSSGSYTTDSGMDGEFTLDFPIITNPSTILDLLGGKDVDLVTVDMPTFYVSVTIEKKFIVYVPPPVYVRVAGTFTAKIDIDFGYDTRGIRTYLITKLPEDLADGFYVLVKDPDTGERKAQFTLSVTIEFGAGLDLGIIDIYAGGGITGTGYFYLHDVDGDGKVRWKEMAEVFEANDGWIFDVRVTIEIFFEVKVTLHIPLLVTTLDIQVVYFRLTITVYDQTFDIALPPRLGTTEPTLGGYILYLNMGPYAGNRQASNDQIGDALDSNGNTVDASEEFYVWCGGDCSSTTSQDLRIKARLVGTSTWYVDERTVAYWNIVEVRGFGGQGNDIITIDPSVLVPTELHGGAGDDTLVSGANASSVLYGDDGNDTLTAGGSPSNGITMYGGSGNDTLNGGAGPDTMYGSSGNDSLFGNGGDDILVGGAGNDTLAGGEANDTYVFTTFGGDDTVTEAAGATAGTNDILDFSAAIGYLNGSVDSTGIHLIGWGYSVNSTSSSLEFEQILGSRGSGTLSISATGSQSLYIDGLNGSDTYIVYLNPAFDGPLSIKDTGDIWNTDRLFVHGTSGNDYIRMTSTAFYLLSSSLLPAPTGSPIDPTTVAPADQLAIFNYDEDVAPADGNADGTHGMEFMTIYLHAGDDTLDARGATPVNIEPVIYPDDKNDFGTDTIYGSNANETFIFLKNWGLDYLDAGGGFDTIDYRVVDDRLLIKMGGAGGLDLLATVEDLDTNFLPIGSKLSFVWYAVEQAWGGRSKYDALQGRDIDSQWIVDGLDNQYVIPNSDYPDWRNPPTFAPTIPYTLHFINMERLYGGSAADVMTFSAEQYYVVRGGAGDDIFRFTDGATLADLPQPPDPAIQSTIDGQGGNDTLDYSAYTTDLTIDLSTGEATNIGSGDVDRLVNL